MTDDYARLSNFAGAVFDRHDVFRSVAEKIGDKRIFLTGGTGLFGQWVIALAEWMHRENLAAPRLTVLSRRDALPQLPFVTAHLGTIDSFEFPSGTFDLLIHLAAPSARDTFNGMTDRDKLDQLYAGTSRVLDFTARQVSGRSLFASSGAVYGGFDASHTAPIKEDDRTAPLPSFNGIGLGLGKRVAEFLVMDRVRAGDVDAGIARAFSFVGPGLPTDLHYAIGNFVARAVRGEDIRINGDGLPVRSFMHMGDAMWWLFTILLAGEAGDDFNVGSPEAVTIAELATRVRQVVNPDIAVEVAGASNLSPGNPLNHYYVPDTSKGEAQLGLGILTNLEDALADYAAFLRLEVMK